MVYIVKEDKMVKENLIMEDVRIFFKNFSGKEGQFNRAGNRNFCVAIDDIDEARRLASLGWNIKALEPREEGADPQPYLQVAVNYKNIEPNIYMVTNKNKVRLSENTVGNLDSADIKSADIIISPYNWEVNGKSGVKAYCKTMYVTIDEDVFAGKYTFEDSFAQAMDDIPFV